MIKKFNFRCNGYDRAETCGYVRQALGSGVNAILALRGDDREGQDPALNCYYGNDLVEWTREIQVEQQQRRCCPRLLLDGNNNDNLEASWELEENGGDGAKQAAGRAKQAAGIADDVTIIVSNSYLENRILFNIYLFLTIISE